ncbi:MAG: hypothetical protein M5U34_22210 [Chloroflexi bacterium]|nr:hypothetical protein [Chloroflexota bacterium]
MTEEMRTDDMMPVDLDLVSPEIGETIEESDKATPQKKEKFWLK